jgi:hypothetical protein
MTRQPSQPLQIHSDCRCDPSVHIQAGAARVRADLYLRYRLTGIGNLIIPAAGPSSRADGLWRHTCFEAFLRAPSGDAYVEMNLSPSTAWAAYRFSGYRAGMTVADGILPEIALGVSPDELELEARVNLSGAPDLADCAVWHVGLAAVIEETNGRLSYWALAHPPGKPDFHHRDGFALGLSQ